ncbi:hypothetical protein [Caballeronia sp. LZ034LL]|uniref:hypothetical protein n=1 Tax=Caballeronia sp. LZ034LL TaxID=3038567 RepID=UPI002864201C|nr:hypothetical protein [Caballeronia sp. LZ034LL]MDR5833525.1 hypothetical protein [Caballeronia sp. LZ034LL]
MRPPFAERLISRSVNMRAIVTQHLIVNWRKKTGKTAQTPQKEEKRLIKKALPDGALQHFFVL